MMDSTDLPSTNSAYLRSFHRMIPPFVEPRRLSSMDYAQAQRSPAEIAARVPPTHHQYQLAVEYGDEATILDYLDLCVDMEQAMIETNQYIVLYGMAPPPCCFPGEYSTYKHEWFWPSVTNPRADQKSLFAIAAERSYLRVIAWFYGSPIRMMHIRETLQVVLPWMLRKAATFGHLDVLDLLLTSRVFTETLSEECQIFTLHTVLRRAEDASVCDVLVAHGACVDNITALKNPLDWTLPHVGSSIHLSRLVLSSAICRNEQHAVTDAIRQGGVMDVSVLITAIQSNMLWAVDVVLSEGFVDVNARGREEKTALMECALACDVYMPKSTQETHHEIVKRLLHAHADATLTDADGRTALHLAIGHGNLTCIELLLTHMGRYAVHKDYTAAKIACEQYACHHRYNDVWHRVLLLLIQHGTCPQICDGIALNNGNDVETNSCDQCSVNEGKPN